MCLLVLGRNHQFLKNSHHFGASWGTLGPRRSH